MISFPLPPVIVSPAAPPVIRSAFDDPTTVFTAVAEPVAVTAEPPAKDTLINPVAALASKVETTPSNGSASISKLTAPLLLLS